MKRAFFKIFLFLVLNMAIAQGKDVDVNTEIRIIQFEEFIIFPYVNDDFEHHYDRVTVLFTEFGVKAAFYIDNASCTKSDLWKKKNALYNISIKRSHLEDILKNNDDLYWISILHIVEPIDD